MAMHTIVCASLIGIPCILMERETQKVKAANTYFRPPMSWLGALAMHRPSIDIKQSNSTSLSGIKTSMKHLVSYIT